MNLSPLQASKELLQQSPGSGNVAIVLQSEKISCEAGIRGLPHTFFRGDSGLMEIDVLRR
jgi:hypothetical protein